MPPTNPEHGVMFIIVLLLLAIFTTIFPEESNKPK